MAMQLTKDAGELAQNAARMQYLAVAANLIESGSDVGNDLERQNIVMYLLSTIEELGKIAVAQAEGLEHDLRRAAA